MREKIAVLTDSGSDLVNTYSKDLFILPLIIQIDGKSYTDGVDITLEEVFKKLDTNKITTSLPEPSVILETFDKIKELGYTHVIVPTISSGLSGTHNIVRMLASDYEGLEIKCIDTLNISKGSGYSSYYALELIKQGLSFNEIISKVEENLDKSKFFFTLETVEYLRRGGRIGLVAGTIASVLNIKPIISCNEKGVYYTVKKNRGYNKAINTLIDVAKTFADKAKNYDVTVLVGIIDDKINSLIDNVKTTFNKIRNFEVKVVTPALAIHTGPNAFGLAINLV